MFEREFPRLSLRFGDDTSKAFSAEAVKSAHRVFAMVRFTAHTQQDQIPRSKLQLVRGGMDALRDALQAYTSTIPLREEHIGVIHDHKAQEEEDMGQRLIKFEPVRDLKPGESYAIERPNVLTKADFRARIQQSSYNYRTTYDMQLDVSYDHGGDIALVTNIKGVETPIIPPAPPATPIAEPLAAALLMPKPDPPAPPPQKNGKANDDLAFFEQVLLHSVAASPETPITQHIASARLATEVFRMQHGA